MRGRYESMSGDVIKIMTSAGRRGVNLARYVKGINGVLEVGDMCVYVYV